MHGAAPAGFQMHFSFVCAQGLINQLSCSISSYTSVIDYASLPCFHDFVYQLINAGEVLREIHSPEGAGKRHSSVQSLLKPPEAAAAVVDANQQAFSIWKRQPRACRAIWVVAARVTKFLNRSVRQIQRTSKEVNSSSCCFYYTFGCLLLLFARTKNPCLT